MPAPVRTAQLGSGVSDAASFQSAILGWYAANGRALNFRRRRDAYAVLVSEAMAQQTQISRVEPAWEAFLEKFPTVEALAAAPTAEVLRAWAGMGYNRRAVNLQRAARTVVADFGGVFPDTVAALEQLPGIGPYTARAVAAIAFGRRVGAVDTNVRRVVGRATWGSAVVPPRDLQVVADELVPQDRAGEWTHALMDIGARFCRPRSPLCDACPARAWCRLAAERAGAVADVPAAPRERSAVAARARKPPSGVFTSTTRWLRGRIIDRARIADGDSWITLAGPIGEHDAHAVRAAVAALVRDGLLEIDTADPVRARLPQ